MSGSSQTPGRTSRAPLLAATATVLVWAAAAFLPAGRHWGLDVWRPLPVGVVAVLTVVGLGLALLAHRRATSGARGPSSAAGAPALLALLVLAPILFVLFRTRAHFLGDGYQNLALLAADEPLLKASARGTLQILVALKGLFGGGEAGAALAYRALAVGSGVAFLAIAAAGARALLPDRSLRPGFVLLLASSGPVLLFFGYVENYAAFVTVTAAYTLFGVHAARTGRVKWIAPALVAPAIFLHGLGFALVPSLFWLLLDGSPIGRALVPASRAIRAALLAGGIVLAAIAVSVLRSRSLAAELALLPWTPDRFTVDGYTLLSAAHLLDFGNLLLLLMPALAIPIACAFAAGLRGAPDAPGRFLLVLLMTTLGACFVVDPKLGMPRDWDLFAFAGVPLAVASAWTWAIAAGRRPSLRPWGVAAAGLSLLVLGARIHVQGSPDRAVEPFREFLALDRTKSRNAWVHLVNYQKERGRSDLADREVDAWDRAHPERKVLEDAARARVAGDLATAERLNREAIRLSPQYFDAYNNLGDVLLELERNDEARQVLEIAHALDPMQTDIFYNLGVAHYVLGDEAAGVAAWRGVLDLDPRHYLAHRNLARVAQTRGDVAAYDRHTAAAARSPDASARVLAEWGAVLRSRGRDTEARAVFREALARGLDPDARSQVLAVYPDLVPPADSAPPAPSSP